MTGPATFGFPPRSLFKAGRLIDASFHYDKAIALDPSNAVYRANRAAVLVADNKLQAATAELLRAAALAKPDYHRPRERLCQIATKREARENPPSADESVHASPSETQPPFPVQGLDILVEAAQAARRRDPDNGMLEIIMQQLTVVAAARSEGNNLFLRGNYADADRVYGCASNLSLSVAAVTRALAL